MGVEGLRRLRCGNMVNDDKGEGRRNFLISGLRKEAKEALDEDWIDHLERCPNKKGAVAWYDNCMLRYSDRSYFGVMETNPPLILSNTQNVSSDSGTVEAYFQALRSLLDNLKSIAMTGGSLRKFSVDNVTAPGFKTIYGLMQCTPDLSQMDCNNCLDTLFGIILGCCNGN
ncbi:cysteine-rich receptor-like protein kinase 29 [Humulus lupulus]|uniref:cysteine-rich receptor-like protein kinase 29 n=1 Tax=Humulus lupulus TaxID=3486 RepID=UPI002B417C2E|nr:cysteine-rich receptor-like protein kinase 29 [Humulus lupulus]